MPINLFNGVITNQQERTEFAAKIMGFKVPLSDEQRRIVRRVLDEVALAAEMEFHRKIRELINVK